MNTALTESRSRRVSLAWQSALYIAAGAFLLRLLMGVLYTNDLDTAWNLMWAQDLQNGFFTAYSHVRQLDYPPLYLYALGLVGRFAAIPGVMETNELRMLIIKFFPILFDSLSCLVLYRLGSRRSPLAGLSACALWAANPAAILNCALWGQTDCVMIFFLLAVFVLLFERKYYAAAVIYGLCITLKLQCAYLAPVVALELLKGFGGFKDKRAWLKTLKAVGLAFAAFTLVWLPFAIGAGKPLLPLDIYLGGFDTYQYVTLNADNIYGLFSLNWVSDSETLLGQGCAFFSTFSTISAVLLVAFSYFKSSRTVSFLSAVFLLECVFMLTVRQHERYQITVLIFLLCAVVTVGRRRWLAAFSAQSLIVLLNQLRVLLMANHSGGWQSYADTLQAVNSFVNILLFAYIAICVFKNLTSEKGEPADAQADKRPEGTV